MTKKFITRFAFSSLLILVVLGFGFGVVDIVHAQGADLNKLDPLEGQDLISLIKGIIKGIRQIAIPIVVILIIWAGIMFMTSQGDPAKVTKARQTLMYTLIGFAIILIGEGFLSLIQSILNLRG